MHNIEDTYGGVTVSVLPSLSGTDSWHYKKGYVKNNRAAEAYLWHHDDGYAGHGHVRDGADVAKSCFLKLLIWFKFFLMFNYNIIE